MIALYKENHSKYIAYYTRNGQERSVFLNDYYSYTVELDPSVRGDWRKDSDSVLLPEEFT